MGEGVVAEAGIVKREGEEAEMEREGSGVGVVSDGSRTVLVILMGFGAVPSSGLAEEEEEAA